MARRKQPVATLEGVELPLHPGHEKGEDPWGERTGVPIPIRDPEVRDIAGARALLTIDREASIWGGTLDVTFDEEMRGAIVRVQPPDVSEEKVSKLVRALEAAGAEVVRVGPRRRSSVLPAARAKQPHESARQVVEQLVGEAHVEDREALRAFVDGVMNRQGLR